MNHKQLMQQVAEMKAQMDSYKGELDNLRNQVSAYENVETPISTSQSLTTSRRKLLKRMGLGVAGFGAMAAAGAFNSTQTLAANPTNSDNAIDATAGSTGYAVAASSPFAPLYLDPNTNYTTGAPVGATHKKGEMLVDSNGSLYFGVADGNANDARNFRKVASANTYGDANGHIQSGSYFLLPSSDRFVDTRGLNGNALGRPIGSLNSGGTAGAGYTTNPLTATPGRSGNQIPAGATAVVGNVSVIVHTAPFSGAIKIFPGNNSNLAQGTAVISFSGGSSETVFLNGFTSPLAPNGTLRIGLFSFGAGNFNCDVIIDVFGYYF